MEGKGQGLKDSDALCLFCMGQAALGVGTTVGEGRLPNVVDDRCSPSYKVWSVSYKGNSFDKIQVAVVQIHLAGGLA